MPKILNIHPGVFSGKMGNLVYCYNNGTWYVRRRPVKKITQSAKQQASRNRFKTCIAFYHALNGILMKPIWKELGKLTHLTGLNAFIQTNIQSFSPERSIKNYERLHFSAGILKLPMDFKIEKTDDEEFTVSWNTEWMGTHDAVTDQLYAGAIYDDEPFRPRFAESATGSRAEGKGIIRLPKGYSGHCHLYCYFASENRKYYSEDKYFRV